MGTAAAKKGRWPVLTAHIKIKSSVTFSAVDQNGSSAAYIASLNLVNLRDLFGVKIKLKESIFKNKNQINFTVTTRAWV